MNAQCNR